jgi:hypothetical protein
VEDREVAHHRVGRSVGQGQAMGVTLEEFQIRIPGAGDGDHLVRHIETDWRRTPIGARR